MFWQPLIDRVSIRWLKLGIFWLTKLNYEHHSPTVIPLAIVVYGWFYFIALGRWAFFYSLCDEHVPAWRSIDFRAILRNILLTLLYFFILCLEKLSSFCLTNWSCQALKLSYFLMTLFSGQACFCATFRFSFWLLEDGRVFSTWVNWRSCYSWVLFATGLSTGSASSYKKVFLNFIPHTLKYC